MSRWNKVDPSQTPVRNWRGLDFSFTGFVYCSIMMLMGVAAVNTQANLLFAVFGLMVGVLLVSGVISRSVLRRLQVKRVLPEYAFVGKPTTVTYEFTNRKRLMPSFSVMLGEQDGTEAFTRQPVAYMLHAAPRMTATVPIELLPKRRGLHALARHQLSTSFPFGFIRRAVDRVEKDTIVVFPAMAEVDPRLMQLCRSADQSGATMRPRRGGDDEFYGVKEFRQGENPRNIYWRRSARTGVLVAKEMTKVAPPTLLILVDTLVDGAGEASAEQVERCIAMAGSLASSALESGLMAGLGAYIGGDETWLKAAPNRGKRHRRDLLSHLAQLPLNRTHGASALLESSRSMITAATTAVLITPQEIPAWPGDAQRASLLVIGAGSAQAQRWFRVDPSTDFGQSVPADQRRASAVEGR